VTVTVSLQQVRDWIGVPVTALPDDQLQVVLDGELELQAIRCRIDPDNEQPSLVEAIYRRCARAVAAKAVPLGTIGDAGEYGPIALKRFDGEIERLEQPTEIFVFG